MCSQANVAVTESPVGTFSVPLATACTLPQGTYWLAVQGRLDYTPYGQYYWATQSVQTGSMAVWRNPGGGFASVCTSWGTVTGCASGWTSPDFSFQVWGSVGAANDLIFDDGFESGNLSGWTTFTP